MKPTQLPSGRWRQRVWDAAAGRHRNAADLLTAAERAELDEHRGTFPTKTAAKAADRLARPRVREQARRSGVTVAQFRERWLTDPLFTRPKQSTMLHNAERTRAFAAEHGHRRIADIGDDEIAAWIAGGRNRSTIPALRAMWNDAASAKAGRIVSHNPFAGLGLNRGSGRKHQKPPSIELCQRILAVAREITPPSFADWLTFAAGTGARPCEVDALQDDDVDLNAGRAHLQREWNAKTRELDTLKNHLDRRVVVPPFAVAALRAARTREHAAAGEPAWTCITLRGRHYTPSSRHHHWNRVRCAVGLPNLHLYLATRHYAGWYLTNVLLLPAEDVAIQLGHTDGGKLVRTLYGHREHADALDRIDAAFRQQAQVIPLQGGAA